MQKWIGEELDETARSALLLELDKQCIGGVTRRALDRFSGPRTLKECINDLRTQLCMYLVSLPWNMHIEILLKAPEGISPSFSVISLSPVSSTSSSMSLEPTLIWVDDKMENNKMEIQIATSLQIRVIQLPSTAVAKLWIEQNESQSSLLIKMYDSILIRYAVNDS